MTGDGLTDAQRARLRSELARAERDVHRRVAEARAAANSDDPEPARWALFVPCRLWTLNEEIREHWTWRQQVRKAVRGTAKMHASRLLARGERPPEPPVRLLVVPQARRLNQDAAGCVTVAKPAIDGLVDAGALPGDGPSVVLAVTFEVAQRALRPADEGLVITILPAEL